MRYVLLDRITSIDLGKSLTAKKAFPLSQESFHRREIFTATVPESLLVEAMAQAGGVLLSSEQREEPSGLVFAKIESAEFSRPVVPGEVLDISACVMNPGEEAARLRSCISSNSDTVAEMVYFLAYRSLEKDLQDVDERAFERSHRERGFILGIESLLGGER